MGRKRKRIYVIEELEDINSLFVDGMGLEDVISSLASSLQEYEEEKGFIRLWLSVEQGGYEYEYPDVHIMGERLENDKEYERRVKKEIKKAKMNKQEKQEQKEREIAKMKKLMEKYPEEVTI